MRTLHIPRFGGNLQEMGRLWRVSDCEELVRVTHRMMGWFNRKGLLSVLPVFADQRD